MSVEQQIRAASSPGEQLLILARAIDALTSERAITPVADPWAIPDAPLREAEAVERAWDESAARANYERKLALLGDRPIDAEEAQAWDASRALLKDMLKPPTPNIGVTQSAIQREQVGPDQFQVTVPKATPEQREQRVALAKALKLDQSGWWTRQELTLDPADALRGYELGGPLWLHAYDRDFVLQCGLGVRKAMVEDVALTSPDDAFELGRDILMDRNDELGGNDAALDALAKAAGTTRDNLGV